jgi:hypothetical protein
VLDLARQLDLATNPHPSAIFEAGNGGFEREIDKLVIRGLY